MQLDDITIARLADAIAVRLSGKYQSRTDAVYTSNHLPPDVSSRSYFNLLAKNVPGAVKRGRSWVVRIDAWEKFREPPPVLIDGATRDPAELVRLMMREIGR